jgi:hypothetical protein
LGKIEITCEVAVGCCARMVDNKAANQKQTAKSTVCRRRISLDLVGVICIPDSYLVYSTLFL